MLLKCIIVDDDLMARKSLEHLCKKVKELDVLGSFEHAQEGLDFLATETVDLIFLDIEMPEMSGLEFVEHVKILPQVIFTTSNIEYAYDAFEYQATDFLKKPLALPRFIQAIEKAKDIQQQNQEYKANAREVYVKEGSRYTRLPFEEILYFENVGDYVKIQTHTGSHIIHSTLKSIDGKLSSAEFMKVHRSYIVNLKKIKDIEESTLVIEKKVIPISRANKPILMGMLNFL